jgi:hypothetical protein
MSSNIRNKDKIRICYKIPKQINELNMRQDDPFTPDTFSVIKSSRLTEHIINFYSCKFCVS